MRLALVAVFATSLFATSRFAASAAAQDLPTTHDHGITITPDHLTTAIQETQDFWGPVRKHLLSGDCTLGDASPRTEAVAFLKSVHDGLQHRLFERTEADAQDLVLFLSHRLRSFEVYRRLRATLNDDVLTLAVVETLQKDLRDIHELPAAERDAHRTALGEKLVALVKTRGAADDKVTAAKQLVDVQLAVLKQVAATDAGKMLIDFEAKAKKLDPSVGRLLLEISTAADWVLIVREQGREIGRADFLAACAAIHELRAKQTAEISGAVKR
jgi:hypothetical protein